MNEILKERLRRCEWLIDNGYTADVSAGKVYNPDGFEVGTGGDIYGYKIIGMPTAFDKKLKSVKVHQYIFYYHHRTVVDVINHIDQNKSNNSISNLEESSLLENMWNRPEYGVYWKKSLQKWVAQIQINKKRYHIGSFKDYDLAVKTYKIAKQLRDSFQVDNTISPKDYRNLIKQELSSL
jgi:hypothetical protein